MAPPLEVMNKLIELAQVKIEQTKQIQKLENVSST